MNTQMTEARQRLYYPFDEHTFYANLSAVISGMPARAAHLGEAFARNLRGVASTVAVPFVMAHGSVSRRRFQAVHTAEQIRARKHLDSTGVVPQWAKEEATKIARLRMEEEIASPEGRDHMVDEILQELGEHLENVDFSRAADELLRQGVVLTWGALEVLVRDVYRDVRGADPPGPKAALKELFPSAADGRATLRTWGLWNLFQRRHLVVHRRGIVDHEYLHETGEVLTVGQELRVSPTELEKDMEHARDAGVDLLRLIH